MQKMIFAAVIAAALAGGTYFVIQKQQQPNIGSKMEETKKEFMATDSGLKYIVLKEGTGAQAKAGDVATVHYTGWLFDPSAPESKGAKFDSSVDRGEPFQFNLGGGMVIRGWDEGVALMKEGEKRTFILPPEIAYGSNAVGGVIPANATLVFDVELLKLN